MSGYDELKTDEGATYSGMPVGGTHEWVYPEGRWREEKVAPDRWDIAFTSNKRRRDPAPPGSGASEGSQYHWFLLAHQRVKKLGKDTYRTRMTGDKWKLAHKRPYWRRWSSEYADQPSRRERLIQILEAALERLREDGEVTETEQAGLDRF